MTTILAIQGEGWAVVGSDSRISTIFGEASAEVGTLSATNPKIGSNGKYILGAAGDLRAINILHHAFQPPACPPNLKGKKLDQFITTKFIPALRACFDEQGYSQPENKDGKDHVAQQDSQIVCIVNNTIYIIDGDYSWFTNNTGLYGIGSGSSYAIGALCEGLWHTLPLKGEPPMTRFVAEQLATPHWYDISAAQRDFGYVPKVSVAEGLKRLGAWWGAR